MNEYDNLLKYINDKVSDMFSLRNDLCYKSYSNRRREYNKVREVIIYSYDLQRITGEEEIDLLNYAETVMKANYEYYGGDK